MVRVAGEEGSERLAGEASWKVAISVIIFGDGGSWDGVMKGGCWGRLVVMRWKGGVGDLRDGGGRLGG